MFASIQPPHAVAANHKSIFPVRRHALQADTKLGDNQIELDSSLEHQAMQTW